MARADLDKQPGDVAAMFDAIAGRYDLLNDILSAGQVRLWRRALARITGTRPGERVLDLAAGTGTSSLTFTATGADCVACDFSLGMLQAGKSRLDVRAGASGPGQLSFVAGDALRLPFRDGAFDAVTISFGLRNVADPGAGLAEMRRGCPPGGGVAISAHPLLPLPICFTGVTCSISCPRSPGGRLAARKPTSTWPSRSWTGRPSASWPA